MKSLSKERNDQLESLSTQDFKITFTKGIEIPSDRIVSFSTKNRLEIMLYLKKGENLNEIIKEGNSLIESQEKIDFTIEYFEPFTTKTFFNQEYKDYVLTGIYYDLCGDKRNNDIFELNFYFTKWSDKSLKK